MTLQFDILTLFPSLFESSFSVTILSRAISKNLIAIKTHDIRGYTTDRHRTVDDIPYGGGAGMVMKPEPLVAAIEKVAAEGAKAGKKTRCIYFSPQGRLLTQENLKDYLCYDQMILLCGRYEGVDERVVEHFVDEEVSIGDYILTGGEFAAMVFMDALSRLVPGVVGKEESVAHDSFSAGKMASLLEYPQYTRPPAFRGLQVPEILLSGDHKKIEQWRQEQSLLRTQKKRPDLYKRPKK